LNVTEWWSVLTAIALTALVSSLITVFLTRSARQRGIEAGRREALEAFHREQEAAVHLFLSRLSSLITKTCEEHAVPARAQAIVALIRSFRAAVADLSLPLAPEIHRLQAALAALSSQSRDANAMDDVTEAFMDLRAAWPEKRFEIETRLRDLLAQLSTIDHHSQAIADRIRVSDAPQR
jgi:hypothetical protein